MKFQCMTPLTIELVKRKGEEFAYVGVTKRLIELKFVVRSARRARCSPMLGTTKTSETYGVASWSIMRVNDKPQGLKDAIRKERDAGLFDRASMRLKKKQRFSVVFFSPWELEFSFPGSLIYTVLGVVKVTMITIQRSRPPRGNCDSEARGRVSGLTSKVEGSRWRALVRCLSGRSLR